MATAGYSGKPLPLKLGIKEAHKVAILGTPSGFELGALPMGVTLARGLTGKALFDVLVVFTTRRADLVARIDACRPRMQQAAGLWIAWPKRASKVPTDLTENVVRELALANVLVDNKVAALDETWSGLRLVIRLRDR
jgi:hypothetical protein